MAISLGKLFGFWKREGDSRESKEGAESSEKPEERVFFAPARAELSAVDLRAVLEAADDGLTEPGDAPSAVPAADRTLAAYIALRREDPEWAAPGFAFSLKDERGAALAPDRWVRYLERRNAEDAAFVARALFGLLGNGLAIWDEAGKTLKCPDFILSRYFPANLLSAAGLPENSDAYLKLYSEGVNFTDSFHVRMSWIRYGHELMAPLRTGLVLKAGATETALMGPVFFLADAINRFEARTFENATARTAAWSGVADLIRESPYAGVLSSLGGSARIVNAAKLTLEIDKEGNILPVFLRTKLKRSGGIDSTPLLAPAQAAALKKRFLGRLPLTDCIDLGGRSYATLTPEMKLILGAVRGIACGKGKDAGLAKARLIANPVAEIRKALEGAVGESAPVLEAVKDVFVETPEFLSQRILAIGPWERHDISFARPAQSSWFADGEKRYRVFAGGDWHFWSPEEIEAFSKAYEKAQKKGEDAFEFDDCEFGLEGVDIAPVKELLAVIKAKGKAEAKDGSDEAPREASEEGASGGGKGAGEGPAEAGSKEGAKEGKAPKGKKPPALRYGPLIKSNLEVLEYKAELRKHEGFDLPFSGLQGGLRLYPHQVECLAWLQDLWRRGMPGGLLADDMGLGKTLQCLSFLKWLIDNYEALGSPRTGLVIAPNGLVENWRAEGEKYFGEGLGRLMVVTAKKAAALQKLPEPERAGEIAACRWVVASYETVRDRFSVFSNIDWCLVALDEAQRIKNPNTALAESVKSLQSEFWLAMTGTPVENSFLDLWSIMDAVGGGFMGPAKAFMQRYQDTLSVEEAGRELHDLLAGEGKSPDEVRLMLRRLKKDRLKNLPAKTEERVVRVMPEAQAACYESILEDRKWAMSGEAGGIDPSAGLTALARLETCSLFGTDELPENFAFTKEEIAGSARLTAFFEILDAVHARGEKALVFMNHKMFQASLAAAIERRYAMVMPPQIINGSMAPAWRQKSVENFMASPEGRFDVMLLTSRAAGVGLTLTRANNVIHLERWWNPAVEDQCTDRAYRIGQTKDVKVYLPIAESPRRDNAFDLVLDGLLEAKRARSSAVLAPEDEGATDRALFEGVFGKSGR